MCPLLVFAQQREGVTPADGENGDPSVVSVQANLEGELSVRQTKSYVLEDSGGKAGLSVGVQERR